jgi:uncharacterized protein (DUF697 family)
MPTALELASGPAGLTAAVRRGRKILHRRALVAAAAGAMPVPGLDWAVYAALLSRIIPKINAEFGLMPDQLDRLTPHERERVQKAVALVGTVLIGKFITRDLVIKAAKTVGLRLTAGQAARYVPMAGQLLSAMVGYSAIRYIGEEHMKDCVRVALKAELRLPYHPISEDVE